MRRQNFISEDDLAAMLKNMGRGELTTGNVPSYSLNRKELSSGSTNVARNGNTSVRSERIDPRATVCVSLPPYRSKLEASYAAHLDLLQKAGEIRRWVYEPMSLKLSDGKRYRPDFLVVLPLGAEAMAEMHEVKGRWMKNRRDGMTHLKWAAQLYGDVFTFRLIEWKGHGFDGSYVVV